MGKEVSDRARNSRISAGMGFSVRVRVGNRVMGTVAARRLRVAEDNDLPLGKVKIPSVVAVRNSRKTGKLYTRITTLAYGGLVASLAHAGRYRLAVGG